MTRRRRGLAGTVVAGFLVVASAGMASAHVHVESSSTAAGSPAQLSFRVPSESEKAGTTTLVVMLPATAPFTDVSVESMPGWTASVASAKLPSPVTVGGTELTEAPSAVTWTANSAADAIPPEQYHYFSVSVSPLPKQGVTLLFPATQTYSDGSVVHWNQKTPAGGDEPEHPAPELSVTQAAAGNEGEADDATMVAQPVAAPQAPRVVDATRSGDTTARWLGGGGLGLGVIGLLLAGLHTRRTATSGG